MPKVSLKQNERIHAEVRRHRLTHGWAWLVSITLLSVPFFFMFWLFRHGWWGQTVFIVPVVLGIMILLRTFFVAYKNVTLLTTHRIIDIDQRGFFDKHISHISYDQIEDVSGHIKGFFGTMFRYGNVYIETGSSKTEIVLDRIARPTAVQRQINDLRETYLAQYAHQWSDAVADTIIERLHELELPELHRVKKRVHLLIEKLEDQS